MGFLAGPMGKLLLVLYKMLGNYGVSIIVFTVIIKLLLLPLTIKQLKSSKEMAAVQPKLKKLQEKYKNDKEQLNIKTMELYKEHNINPAAGCLPLLFQMPILFGLFTLLRNPQNFVIDPIFIEAIHEPFLWIADLSKGDPYILPLLAGLTTYISMNSMNKSNGAGNAAQNQTMKMMNMIFPVMMVVWARNPNFPAGLALYWVASNLFQIVQQYFIPKTTTSKEELS